MDTVKIPLWLRITAYFIGLITASLGAGLVAWLLAKGHIDNVDAAFLIVILGTVSLMAHILSLANLSLNTAQSSTSGTTAGTLPVTVTVASPTPSVEVYDPATDGGIDSAAISGSEADAPAA